MGNSTNIKLATQCGQNDVGYKRMVSVTAQCEICIGLAFVGQWGGWGRISVRFVVTRRNRASLLVLAFCRFHLLSGEIFILQRYRTVGDIFDTSRISTNFPIRSAYILKNCGLQLRIFLGTVSTQ
jgi:hypothetical protein